ncbi:MAG: hypothetical protein ACRYG4_14810 [Janthinobacterium lividum]
MMRSVGLPTRIGLGPTRALSKVANALAKASEKVWGGVIDLHDVELRRRMFATWPVEEVWGIGGALRPACGRWACGPRLISSPCPPPSHATPAPSCSSAWCAS